MVDVYTRVSQLADERMLSTSGQEADCRARAAEEGLAVGKVHSDPGKSAWNPRVRRPGWDALMARLESGEADGVIVFDLARFTRRPAEGERLIAAAERGLAILDSEHRFDLTSPDGKAAFRDHMKMAAYESDRLSTRVKRGKRMKAARGEYDNQRSFGFLGAQVIEDEAQIIRECAARLLAGEPQSLIMADLTERGVATVRSAPWSYTTFRQIMTRPRNAGAILDETTHRRVVALYESRRPGRPPSGRYLLTGLLYCACGAAMAGRPVTGTNRRQYWCKVKHADRPFVGCEPLELWAADWAIRVLRETDLESGEREQEARRAALTNESVEIESTLVTLAGRLGRREISLARHDAAANPLDARLAEIRDQLAEIDSAPTIPPSRIPQRWHNHGHWLAVWDEGTVAERRAMVARALAGRRMVCGPGQPARFDPERITITP